MVDVRVWVGCLACYNNSRLIGEWVDAVDATAWECPSGRETHEETWCMDQEIPGVDGELSPSTAAAWGEVWANVPDDQADAFAAWLSWAGITDPEDATMSAFEDAYGGEWDSPEAHAWELLESSRSAKEIEEITTGVPYFGLSFDRVSWECDWAYVDGHVFNAHG